MNSHSHPTNNSAPSSSHLFPISHHYQQDQLKSDKENPPPPVFWPTARRPPANKKAAAKKLPITPPRIYSVEPADFKDVVQRLTGAEELPRSVRLKEAAPPPLGLSPTYLRPVCESQSLVVARSGGGFSPLGFSPSPSSMAWCSSMVLSPGNLAGLDTNAVLWNEL